MTQPPQNRPSDTPGTTPDTIGSPRTSNRWTDAALSVEITETRKLLDDASRHLLGATIAVSNDEWRAPSLLPGWTRAHVASHLCRHADAFGRLAAGARTRTPGELYLDDRDAEITEGAERDGLALQTDLDTTIGRLDEEFERLAAADGWRQEVRLRRGLRVPAALLPLGRLFEVTVHYVDLDIGHSFDDVAERPAELCLLWAAIRQQARSDYPALRLITSGKTMIDIGAVESSDPAQVSGPAPQLLGWLTGRTDQSALDGPALDLPSFG